MKPTHMITVAAASFLLLSTSALAREVVNWAPNIKEAKRYAGESGKLVLIHFWTPTCGPCLRLEKEVFSRHEFADRLHANYVPVKVNAHQDRQLARSYGVNRWPTDVVITPDGKVISKSVSQQSISRYIAKLDTVFDQNRGDRGNTRLASTRRDYSENNSYRGRQSSYDGSGNAETVRDNYERRSQPAPAYRQNRSTRGDKYNSEYDPRRNNRSGGISDDRRQEDQRFESRRQDELRREVRPSNRVDDDYLRHRENQRDESSRYTNQDSNAGDPRRHVSPRKNDNPSVKQDLYTPTKNDDRSGRYDSDRYPRERSDRPSDRNLTDDRAKRPVVRTRESDNYRDDSGRSVARRVDRSTSDSNPYNRVKDPVDRRESYRRDDSYQKDVRRRNDVNLSRNDTNVANRRGNNSRPMIDGYSCVAMYDRNKWIKGDARFGAIHNGQLYLFANAGEQQRFLATPDRFAPVLDGNDPVIWVDENRKVPGSRSFGFRIPTGDHTHIYLFSSRATMKAFEKEALNKTQSSRYVRQIESAMQGSPSIRR